MRSVSYPVGKTASAAIWYHTSSFWVVAIFYHCPIYNLATIDYNIFLSFLLSLCCPQTFSSFSGCSPLGCTDWLSPHAEHSCVAYVEADFFFVKKKKEQKCTYQSRKFWESRKADALPPSLALLKYLSQALQHPNAGEDSVGSLIKGSVRAGDDPALRLFRLDHQNCGCPSYGFSHQVCKKPTDTESRGVFPVCAERVLDPQSQHTCSASTCFHTPQTLEQQHSPAFIGSGFSCLHLKAQYPFILPPML